MNRDRMEGKWKELRGKVRERWGKLTDDDLDRISGKKDQLVGRLQERYGWARDQVDREVREFENTHGGFGSTEEPAGRGSGREASGSMDGTPGEVERGAPARAPQRSGREEPAEDRNRKRA